MTGDEVWLAVKFQVSNEFNGGKALNGLGGDKLTEPYQTQNAV